MIVENIKHHLAQTVGGKLFNAVVRKRHSIQSEIQKLDGIGWEEVWPTSFIRDVIIPEYDVFDTPKDIYYIYTK
jgi:hypothetical protein